MTLNLICPVCGQKVSLDAKQLTKVDYLACEHCEVPVPVKLLEALKQVSHHLSEKPDKVANKWIITVSLSPEII